VTIANRFKRITELLAPELSKLAAQNSLKKLSLNGESADEGN
jgi:hypothetical protein